MAGQAILFDSSRCSGCKGCQVACKCWNGLPSPLEKNTQKWNGSLQCPPDLDSSTRLIITFDEQKGGDTGIKWAFGRRACMHCEDPGCVAVCPSGCLRKDEESGLVVYDTDLCIGCQYCRSGCPFDVPRHTGVGVMSGNIRINKCTGCIDRVQQGRKPACVSTCQPGALEFGDRDEMLEIAKQRCERLQQKGFTDAQVYGETQVGGTHVIHVLKYGIDQYELPENPQLNGMVDAMGFMKPLTAVGAVALVGGLGLSFLTGLGYKRPTQVYDEVNHDILDADTGEVIRHIDKEAGER